MPDHRRDPGTTSTRIKQEAGGHLVTILNRLLQDLVLRCAKEEGIRDYLSIAVVGYGKDVSSAFGAGKDH